jgi:hypothetical protein
MCRRVDEDVAGTSFAAADDLVPIVVDHRRARREAGA